jgi:serine/threonine protein kinase
MAALYGERWKIKNGTTLGQGGQSHVFRVIDVRGDQEGDFALKRVLNPARHDRFRNEIDAIKRLDHPNIIKLVDHSALDIDASDNKQFLVMPVAEGGDLSRSDRLGLYKGSIEAVLQVAKQIASGLRAAHAAGIIHRDIKPENILFPGIGHEIWIADFGICLIQAQPRSTETGEVVGPRAFMAPELEDGGRLDASAAADVYSLGKVIYYMISGGVIVPRERLHEATYGGILKRGERLRLLGLLLDQMICPLDRRLKDMDTVIRQLENIEAWEHNARLLPISAAGLAGIEHLQRQVQETQRVTSENTAARDQERRTLENVKETFEAWLRAELEKAAAHISNGGLLACEIGELSTPGTENWRAARRQTGWYAPVAGLELRLELPGDARKHLFQVRLCQEGGISIKVYEGGRAPSVSSIKPVRDLQLAMIPYYRQTLANRHTSQTSLMGFFSKNTAIGTVRNQLLPPQRGRGRQVPSAQSVKVEPVTRSFHSDISQCVAFRASEWPAVTETLRIARAQSAGCETPDLCG